MHLLSLLELAFGQPFFNRMRVSVCVPVWDYQEYRKIQNMLVIRNL